MDNGDSTLIITPFHKNILIDGGGSKNRETFDVGEQVLLPYLLDRGIKVLDDIIISHFDEDHCGGIVTILKELKVKRILISRQIYLSKEFKEINTLVHQKKIPLYIVNIGEKMRIDKDTYIDILYPKNTMQYSDLNNNSLVCKLSYFNFSILFTGDLEEKAEKDLIEEYEKNEVLKSTIIKIAHHGSKGSSTKEFLKSVSPRIALIGVGENNSFGHPSVEVLNKLQEMNTTVYRTDINAEITIRVNKKGKMKIKAMQE